MNEGVIIFLCSFKLFTIMIMIIYCKIMIHEHLVRIIIYCVKTDHIDIELKASAREDIISIKINCSTT